MDIKGLDLEHGDIENKLNTFFENKKVKCSYRTQGRDKICEKFLLAQVDEEWLHIILCMTFLLVQEKKE